MQSTTSAQPARDTTATIAPFCLARVGGVSAQPLSGLALTQTAQHLQAAFEAESQQHDLGQKPGGFGFLKGHGVPSLCQRLRSPG